MTEDEMDDRIDAWHDGEGHGQSLHEFLGMTWDEYRAWVEESLPPRPDYRCR